MKIKNLHDLFVGELRDTYSAEKQLVKALPKMAKAANNPDLREAFESHLGETKNHVKRLEDVFRQVEQKAIAKTCAAMKGLVEEGGELIEDTAESPAADAALIGAAQKVEHYEIATYGCLVCWAEQLGFSAAAKLLNETLDEEKAADAKLNSLATHGANSEARNAPTTRTRSRA